jgi:hypothetical protein
MMKILLFAALVIIASCKTPSPELFLDKHSDESITGYLVQSNPFTFKKTWNTFVDYYLYNGRYYKFSRTYYNIPDTTTKPKYEVRRVSKKEVDKVAKDPLKELTNNK